MWIGDLFGTASMKTPKRIFVNGSFDLLHTGHLDLLNYARSLGDHLLVATDSDDRISQRKGPDRPLCNHKIRTQLLSSLKPVDQVKIFHSDEELINIIAEYSPDVMVVGSDWQGQTIIGSQHSQSIIFYQRINDESTTKILQSYLDRRQLRR